MINDIIKKVKTKRYYEDLYEIPWLYNEELLKQGSQIQNKKKLRIGLINVPCGGFGDIIVCQTFYEYLLSWYPEHDIILCTTTPDKFKKLGINTKGYVKILVHGDDECELHNLLYLALSTPKTFKEDSHFILICIHTEMILR